MCYRHTQVKLNLIVQKETRDVLKTVMNTYTHIDSSTFSMQGTLFRYQKGSIFLLHLHISTS